jgi:hypothetical protein
VRCRTDAQLRRVQMTMAPQLARPLSNWIGVSLAPL